MSLDLFQGSLYMYMHTCDRLDSHTDACCELRQIIYKSKLQGASFFKVRVLAAITTAQLNEMKTLLINICNVIPLIYHNMDHYQYEWACKSQIQKSHVVKMYVLIFR